MELVAAVEGWVYPHGPRGVHARIEGDVGRAGGGSVGG